MRHLHIIRLAIAAILTSAALNLHAESQRFFSSLAGEKGISSVYVGKALLGRALADNGGKLAALTQYGVDEASLRNVNAVEIMHANTTEAIAKLRTRIKQILSESSFDIVSEMTNEGSRVIVYGLPDTNSPQTILCFLLITDRTEDSSLSVISVWGRMQLH